MRTFKVMDIRHKGVNVVCIYDTMAKVNPFKVYKKWYEEGWHRKKLVEYADFQSVLYFLLENFDFRR